MTELVLIKKSGYGESREEYGKDAVSVAFPVLNGKGEIAASLSIQSTINRINDRTRPKFLREGLKISRKISQLLAGC